MSLEDVKLPITASTLPADVSAFLNEAGHRVSQFIEDSLIRPTGFAPSNFVTLYHTLRVIADCGLARGTSLCEWGSGLGVVSLLASMLGFKVCGIEIDSGLVDASRKLAYDFGLPVAFAHGNFIPFNNEPGSEYQIANDANSCTYATGTVDAYAELGLELNEFDLVFVYPWPGEERFVENLFERYAAEDALLLTYNQFRSVRIRRKVA